MNESDDECYEQCENFSPPNQNFISKSRSMTYNGAQDLRRISSHLPPDIDNRPPYPIPKSAHSSRSRFTQLNCDNISVSTVAPDYELSSVSPPRSGYSIPIPIAQQVDNRPPLPPINPNRKPPSRSQSESSDMTPPRSLTMNIPPGYKQHSRSNSESDMSPTSLKPTTHSSSESFRKSSSSNYFKRSSEMPLLTFSEKHREDLPVQVVVTKGYYGPDERTSISDGDMFHIHFFKQTKIVKIQDSNGYKYTVPLNSSLEFGPVYALPSGFKQVDLKYHFKSVGDIMQLKELPKVVRVTRSHRGSSPENSVEQNDLLLVSQVKLKKRAIKSTRVLKCTVAGSGLKKTLSEDCMGHFSVKPTDTKLFLPEIVEHVILPQKAYIYSSSNTRVELPQHLMQSEIEILRVEIEESIIATNIPDKQDAKNFVTGNRSSSSSPLVDIPLDLDIEVAIIKLGDGETNELYAETRSLCEKYNPGEASYLNLPSSITASAQSTLFRTIRQDQNRQVGIEILRPVNAFQSSDASVNRLSNGSDSSRRQLCTPSECANAEEVNGRLEELEMHASNIDTRLNKFELLIQTVGSSGNPEMKEQKQKLSDLQDEVIETRKETQKLRKIVTDLPEQLSKLNSTVDTLQRTVDLLQSDIKKIPKEYRQVSSTSNGIVNGIPHTNGTSPSADFEAQNREFLLRLDHKQVARLLSRMNLSQYVEAFEKEQINGEIMSELSDEVLQQELGMTSKIHRIKLMKVIAGRHSAVSIINGDDPYYVHFAQTK